MSNQRVSQLESAAERTIDADTRDVIEKSDFDDWGGGQQPAAVGVRKATGAGTSRSVGS